MFQFHFLLPEFSALDNVCLPIRKLGRLSDQAAKARAAELLDQFGLEGHHRKKPGQLSGGQRQRVAIARALVNEPSLLLADEPTGNLDSNTSREIMDLFDELHQAGNTVLLVTHEADIAGHAWRQVQLRDGKVTDDHPTARAKAALAAT